VAVLAILAPIGLASAAPRAKKSAVKARKVVGERAPRPATSALPRQTPLARGIGNLVGALERGQITKGQFRRKMDDLVTAEVARVRKSAGSTVRRERIRAAAARARGL
jgi:hypothetical protein